MAFLMVLDTVVVYSCEAACWNLGYKGAAAHLNPIQLPGVFECKVDHAATHFDLHDHGQLLHDNKVVPNAHKIAQFQLHSGEQQPLHLVLAGKPRVVLPDPARTCRHM